MISYFLSVFDIFIKYRRNEIKNEKYRKKGIFNVGKRTIFIPFSFEKDEFFEKLGVITVTSCFLDNFSTKLVAYTPAPPVINGGYSNVM